VPSVTDQGKRLRAARGFGGFSQPELAKKLEISDKTYKLTELGQRAAKRPELLAIAEACEIPMWFLEGGWGNYPGAIGSAGDEGEPRPHDPRGHRDHPDQGQEAGEAQDG
jgi:transcriptional regulator with XRE-family HTH domain